MRAAIARIRRVPISGEARRKVRPFLDELGKVEPRLSDMTRTVAGGDRSRAEDRLGDLYECRPNRAVDAETNLSEALGSYEQFLELYIYTLRGGNRVLTEAGGRRFRREAVRHAREVRRAFADLRGAIGADPLPGPGAEPPAEPDSSPA